MFVDSSITVKEGLFGEYEWRKTLSDISNFIPAMLSPLKYLYIVIRLQQPQEVNSLQKHIQFLVENSAYSTARNLKVFLSTGRSIRRNFSTFASLSHFPEICDAFFIEFEEVTVSLYIAVYHLVVTVTLVVWMDLSTDAALGLFEILFIVIIFSSRASGNTRCVNIPLYFYWSFSISLKNTKMLI